MKGDMSYRSILLSNKRNEVLIHAAMWMNLEVKEASHKKSHITIHLCETSRIGKSIEIDNGCQRLRGKSRLWSDCW